MSIPMGEKGSIEESYHTVIVLFAFMREFLKHVPPEQSLAVMSLVEREVRSGTTPDADVVAKKLVMLVELEAEYAKMRRDPGQQTGYEKFKQEFDGEVARARGTLTPEMRKELQEKAPEALKEIDALYAKIGGMNPVFDNVFDSLTKARKPNG